MWKLTLSQFTWLRSLVVVFVLLLIILFTCNLADIRAFEGSGDPEPRVELQDSPVIEVRRKSSNDEAKWGNSADIAVGGKSSNVHKAEVKIYFDPEPDDSMDVTVSVSGTAANGDGSSPKKSILVFSDGKTVTTLTGIQSATVTVPPEGITGTFTSSNKREKITVKADNESVKINQKWDHEYNMGGRWAYSPYFEYDKWEPVGFALQFEKGVALDNHTLKFYVISVSYLEWDEDEYEWVDHPGVTTNLDQYSKFAAQSDGKGGETVKTSANGTTFSVHDMDFKLEKGAAVAYQIVYAKPKLSPNSTKIPNIIVYETTFGFLDLDSFKP